jgi:hypothetical protein
MAVTTARAVRGYKFAWSRSSFSGRMEHVMNTANNTKRDNRTDALTEVELSKVTGGTPSIPIPPPRPGFLAR